jgi:hypothetical protein
MTTIANREGLIYKIVCNDLNVKDIYVGSCQAFRARKCQHKHNCCNSNSKSYNINVYQFIRANGGWNNWSMLQIETVMFRDKRELLTRERHWIETLKATLNSQIPTRTDQEYREEHKTEMKQYREEHKTQILEKVKQYREKNKTEIKEKVKQYYKSNKQQIVCDCGKSSNKCHILRHKKSKNHKQFEHYYNFIYS